MRLQKYLADAGVASRRACETIISDGRVTVNGEKATLGMSVDEQKDIVLLDGKRVTAEQKRRVIMLYKPRGVVATSSDPEGRKTVQDLITGIPERLYSIGRLDLNSEGLLLMTNDGELANRLMHPRYKVDKTYYCVCDGKLTASEQAALQNGVQLEDGLTAPARVEEVRRTPTGTAMTITIHEGKNRQIRRMLEAVGHRTLRLRREAYGPLTLGDLRSGQWRDLTPKEIASLTKE